MFRWLANRFWSSRARKRLAFDLESAWPAIVRVFANSRDVGVGPTGACGNFSCQALLVEDLLQHGDAAEALLLRHVNDPDPQVAGYCLLALDRCASRHLEEAVALLKDRDDVVHFVGGSLGTWLALSELARMKLEVARQYQQPKD